MPFSVVLQDETGQSLGRAIDRDGRVTRLLLDMPEGGQLLSMLDPYGDTVFNRIQAQSLLAEWSSIEVRAAEGVQKEFCSEVREMLERAAKEAHLYVRFVGD